MSQRLHLTRPLDGIFADLPVRVLEVNSNGALIEHATPIAHGTSGILSFKWRDHEVAIDARVVRNADTEIGLTFTRESDSLRDLIALSGAEILRAQQANVDGDREKNVIGDETLTSASVLHGQGYVTWTLEDDGWKKRRSLLPDQPENGFTVAAAESAEQVEVLRQTWEKGDDEARRMTRMLAELSAGSVRQK